MFLIIQNYFFAYIKQRKEDCYIIHSQSSNSMRLIIISRKWFIIGYY